MHRIKCVVVIEQICKTWYSKYCAFHSVVYVCMCCEVVQYYFLQSDDVLLLCFISPSTVRGPVVGVVGVGGVASLPVLVVTDVAKHRSKDHHGDQDGVGDGEYQHKNKTDDAELFGLLQFVLLFLTEGLSRGGGGGMEARERNPG